MSKSHFSGAINIDGVGHLSQIRESAIGANTLNRLERDRQTGLSRDLSIIITGYHKENRTCTRIVYHISSSLLQRLLGSSTRLLWRKSAEVTDSRAVDCADRGHAGRAPRTGFLGCAGGTVIDTLRLYYQQIEKIMASNGLISDLIIS